MKNRLLLIAAMAFTFFQATAQTNGHFSFTWTMEEDGEKMLMRIELYSSPKYFAISSEDDIMGGEKVIIDRAGKKGIEFFSDIIEEETDERDNYYSSFSWEESLSEAPYVSEVFSGLTNMPDFNDGLEMLAEKSTIAGLPCQKFRINLPDNEGTITGWIATGVHCLIADETFYLDTEKGMIVEMNMVFDGNSLVVDCLGYDGKFAETSPVYSMAIPAGYDALDDMEKEGYYDDEESGDE